MLKRLGTKVVALILLLPVALQAAGLGVYNPAQHAVNGFMPTQLPGLAVWFDAGRTGYTNGTAVDNWSDSSGNLRNATNATASQNPVFSTSAVRPSISFDGIDDRLILTNETAKNILQNKGFFYFFEVSSASALGADMCTFTASRPADTGLRVRFGIASSGANYMFARRLDTDTAEFRTPATATHTTTNKIAVQMYGIRYANSNSLINVNGASFLDNAILTSGVTSNTPSASVVIGAAANNTTFMNGKVYELIGFNDSIENAQITQIQRYLGTKYGIVVQ